MNRQLIEQGVGLILEGLGVDTHDHNFDRTPSRVADVYEELFSPEVSGYPVFDEKYTDMVLLKGHELYTLCPHHLLPVKLRLAVAYIPDGKVMGASKLMRMAHDVMTYPMTQEALTAAIQKQIWTLTHNTSKGEAVLLEGQHGCFSVRGVKSHAASMITVKYGGLFSDNAGLQHRFLTLAKW